MALRGKAFWEVIDLEDCPLRWTSADNCQEEANIDLPLLFGCRIFIVCEDTELGNIFISQAPKLRNRPLIFIRPHTVLTTFVIASRCHFPFMWQVSTKACPEMVCAKQCATAQVGAAGFYQQCSRVFYRDVTVIFFQNWFLHSFSISFSWLAKSKSNV